MINADGTMMGVYSPQDALRIAEEQGLDLIEIAPTAKPPTCRIMDYGKWKYENKKKANVARKKQTIVITKEIQLRPRTEDHDLNVKLKHARKFLVAGDKVKVNLRFSGREMEHQEIGMRLLQKATELLSDVALLEVEAKKEGKQLFILLAPDSVKIKEFLKLHPEYKQTEAKEN